jgi:transcriptional regulator with XRE-family HTH domain
VDAAEHNQRAFGRNVRRLRLDRDLTQEALANLAGLHPTRISFVETGSREVRLDTIIRIAYALDVEPGDLFAGVRKPSKARPPTS